MKTFARSFALSATLAMSVLSLAAGLPESAQAQQARVPPAPEQIAGAVLPLPVSQREGATVLGFREPDVLETLRRGSGDMICIADAPGDDRFHTACYHESLEPFMARGRELRSQGYDEAARDSIRAEEAASGAMPMPDAPAALFSLTGPASAWDPDTGAVTGARPLHVVYIPWATAEETGLPTEPDLPARPWLMFPGSYRAHIMIIPPPPGG